MATKTKRLIKKNNKVTSDTVTKITLKEKVQKVIHSHTMGIRWAFIVGICILAIVGFWYKTHTWPITAFVNYEPITRFELDQMMYSRVGAEALDALITQRLVSQELRNRKISVTSAQIDAKIEEIKKQLGPDNNIDQILKMQNMTLADLKSQIEFQLKLEKLVPASTDSAALQESVANEISTLRTKAKVWMIK